MSGKLQMGIDGQPSPGGDDYKFLFETSTTKKFNIGQRVCLSNGAVFHYAYALTAIDKQLFAAAGTVPAGHQGCLTLGWGSSAGTVASAGGNVGDYKVRIQCSGTAITANQYAGGQYVISSNSLAGSISSSQVCWIKSHPAAVASAVCELELYNPLLYAVDTRCKGNLIMNPFMNVKAHDGAAGNWPVGLTTTNVAATSYCWLQTWGPTGVRQGALPAATIGGNFIVGTETGGVVSCITVAGMTLYPIAGVLGNVVGAAGQLTPAFIRIMP
jgi:hypothetical protein